MSAVDAWLHPVQVGISTDPGSLAVLATGERDRVAALGFSADRDRAVTARLVARTELGRRLGVPAAEVPLTSSEGEGPVVPGWSGGVSWSHSGSWIALAVSDDRPVGIDIEKIPEPVPVRALTRIGVASIAEFVDLEAASKATACAFGGRWPAGVQVRRLPAPDGYCAAVAAYGSDWVLNLQSGLVGPRHAGRRALEARVWPLLVSSRLRADCGG